MSNLINMKRHTARSTVLSKRVKNMWNKSGSALSLKEWVRQSDDSDAKSWMKLKLTKPVKKVRVKIVKKSKAEKSAEKSKTKKAA